jgi:hypothetical protein
MSDRLVGQHLTLDPANHAQPQAIADQAKGAVGDQQSPGPIADEGDQGLLPDAGLDQEARDQEEHGHGDRVGR